MAIDILKRAKHALKAEIVKRVTSDRSADLFVAQLVRDETPTARLNIILPTILSRNTFGGISTALRFFYSLAPSFDNLRIIVMGDATTSFEAEKWQDWAVDDSRGLGGKKQIYFLERKNKKPLSVRKDDIFIATEWQTAYLARDLLFQQRESYGHARKLIYLLQDFEPGFHPWSSRFLLASSTYYPAAETIAVFNTSLLQKYFHSQGHKFFKEFCFEPKLNPTLKAYLEKNPMKRKKKTMVLYGRPHNLRNAFAVLSLGVQSWAREYPESSEWRVISMGASHAPIELANGIKIEASGKLSLSDYAATLSEASVGISLMVSPHPSYPPLEMAAFGLKVITNSFANKDLSLYHPNITSLQAVTPDTLAQAIREACQHSARGAEDVQTLGFTNYDFCGDSTEFSFRDNLLEMM